MGDKKLPTFSFGAPASTSGSAGSIFGTAGSAGNTPNNVFGSISSNTTNTGNTPSNLFGSTSGNAPSTGGLFGNNSNNTANTGSLFGNNSSNTASNTASTGGNMFSGGGGSGGFSFKKTTPSTGGEEKKSLFSTNTDNKASANLFAPSPSGSGANSPLSNAGSATGTSGAFSGFSFNNNTAQTPAKPAASAEPISTTPALKPFAGFGNTSTTPAGAPPPAASFSASTGGAAPSLFGNPGSKPTSSAATMSQPTPAPSLFGGGTSAAPTFSWNPPTPSASNGTTPPTVTTTQASNPPFSFPASGLHPAPAQAASTTSQATPSLFAKPSAPANASGTKSPFNFDPATTAPGSTQSQLFGGKPNTPFATAESTSQTPATTSTAAQPGSPFTLGIASSSAAPSTSSITTTTSAPAPTGLSFFSSQPTTAASTAPTTGGFGFPPATTTSSAQATATTAPAPTTSSTFQNSISQNGPVPQPQSRLKNKTMDEILTRWASDLTKYTKDFRTHAETVSQWDQILVANLTETQKIYAKTVTSEKQMQSVEMALSAVEKQQDELENWLTRYERDVDEMMARNNAGQGGMEMGGPDQEREKTYKLAERLGERLDGMGRDLTGMIEEVNSVTGNMSRNGGRDEPVTQIVKILNSHLTQLQEIDQGTAVLQEKVTAAQKAASKMGYANGMTNGDGRAAVDDFYRSYMGRR